jgi:diguanylate cyclase (GGDEF)-like protein
MSQQVGLFLNPVGQRRVDFQNGCGGLFDRLYLADGTEHATDLMSQQHIDLLVIDLDRFDRSFDLGALGALIAARAGLPTLILCPFTNCGWLPELMSHGPVTYGISPLASDELHGLIEAQLAGRGPVQGELAPLLATRERLQSTLFAIEDSATVAEQICAALCGHDGVIQAALFLMDGDDELQLAAQQSSEHFNLVQILNRSDRLLQSPLRHSFPGLLAACSGELSLLDTPAKAGDPELALTLLDKNVEMILGAPLGRQTGALCLMFKERRQFSAAEIHAFAASAQLAGASLAMAALRRENEVLRGQLAHLATVDALTGVVNRRHGETLLEQEIKRSRRYRVPVALIGFDIDRFKHINDQFGHPVGDAVLRGVAEITRSALRANDILVRSGGQEFQIIAPHTSAIEALKVAEKIRMAIADTEFPGVDRITISLGVAQVADQESADSLAVRVNAALARAKRAGRNCVELAML